MLSAEIGVVSPAFVQDHRANLERWCRLLTNDSGPILAIARKGPRLLELAARAGFLSNEDVQRVTSERALPLDLLDQSSRSVLTICDDICIYGSTFRRIVNIAVFIYGSARVRGLPFTVSDHALDIPFEVGRGFTIPEEYCTSFVNTEIAAFASLDKPYDIEHPILYLDLHGPLPPRIVELALGHAADALKSTHYGIEHRFASATGQPSQHHSWTLLVPSEQGASPASIRKIRCYYDEQNCRLALVPIAPVVGSLASIGSMACRLPEPLSSVWEFLESTVKTPDSSFEPFQRLRERSLISWANYLIELALLLPEIRAISRQMVRDDLARPSVRLTVDSFDVQLLVGNKLAASIASRINEYVRHDSPQERLVEPRNHKLLQPELPKDRSDDYRQICQDLLPGSSTEREALEALFKAQHVAVERPSRETTRDDELRLEFGVPFSWLGGEVCGALGRLDEVELNRALDELIDSGVIVPLYLPQLLDGETLWCRSFRVGEGQVWISGHVVKECFSKLCQVMTQDVLGEVQREKFLVLLTDLRQIFRDPTLSGAAEITRRFHLYGARPVLLTGSQEPWVMDWACSKRILRESEGGYRLHENVERDFRRDENPMGGELRHEVAAMARWAKEASGDRSLGNDFLVAITTVESHCCPN